MASQQPQYDQLLNFIEDCKDADGDAKYEKALSGLPPKDKSLIVDWNDLYAFDEGLATLLLNKPKATLEEFIAAASMKMQMRAPAYLKEIKKVRVRIQNPPFEIPIRMIRAADIGSLIMISGVITRATVAKPLITDAMYICLNCSELIPTPQPYPTLQPPEKCSNPTCNSRRLLLDPSQSKYMDVQWLTAQERPEDLPPGQMPHGVRIRVRDDLVGKVNPGDRVKITCTIEAVQKDKFSLTLDTYLDANHLETIGTDQGGLEITPEDEKAILELAEDPWIHRRLLQSIAPSIKGLDEIKEAILYLLFRGVAKELPDVRIKGDINVLLVGDPGTGKSQLLQYTAKTAPRGILTTGRGSTAAGLTAAAIKEKGGNFVLEAGALVLADKGVCCIDELDKMREEDRGAIHPAMEQQVVNLAKGGIVATLNARTAILAAANPVLGRYNPYQTIAENINLPVTLLNRFDLIFVLRDLPNPEKDAKIVEHILASHRGGAVIASVDSVLFRKYIAYAKRIDPVLSEESGARLGKFYLDMRGASMESGEASAISITARQVEGLIRLTEARARLHLREETTVEDADAAIALTQRSLEQVGIDVSTGKIDIDILYSGKSRSLQMQLQVVLTAISEMSREGAVRDEDLFEALAEKGLNRTEAVRLIGVLMRDGTIYSPKPGYHRRT